MSTFKVSIERIGSVENHPNADRLDTVKVEGKDFDIITGRGNFAVGDLAVFFPVDSVLPLELSDKLEITKNLKNGRIKTIKLRGMFSQGFVVAPGQLFESVNYGDDVTERLGVTKYEPIEFAPNGPNRLKTDSQRPGHLRPLPEGVVKYDLEGAQGYVKVVEQLMDQPVYISEKMEGSHWGCTIDVDGYKVFQRNFAIDEAVDVEHLWWKEFRKGGYINILSEMLTNIPGANRVTLRGEIVGPSVQSNYYGFSDTTVYIFEIEVNDKPVDAGRFCVLSNIYGLQVVPTLAYDIKLRDWLDGKTVTEASDGKSVFNDKAREGIVIKPMNEQFSRELGGRLVLKQRGPAYLAKTDL